MNLPRYHSAKWSSALNAYPVRIMLGLVMSLSLILALVRLPLEMPLNRVGWSAHSSAEQIVLENVTREQSDTERSDDAAKRPQEAPPVTALRSPGRDAGTRSSSPENSDTESYERKADDLQKYKELQSITELGITDRTPQIVGGLGSLYLNIHYPEKARRQGIEGQLELEFTVGTDGSVTDIEVTDSLHPLCDSAAVEGIRSVDFVPAKHDGTPIPIRLKLPVRFQLTAVSSTLQQNGRNP